MENPMALYTVASNRETSRPVDRIYGIMQVFDFQLGISAPGADAAYPPDLPQLEVQLGKQLLADHPIMSQMHIHTKPVEVGQGWRVSSSSVVPELVTKVPFIVTRSFLGVHTALCKLSTRIIDGVLWGSFSGKVCKFELLQRAWASVDQRVSHRTSIQGKSTQEIILDSTDMVPMSAFAENPQSNIPRDERQHRLASQMVDLFHQAHLLVSVLLLGRFSDEEHGEDWWEMAGGRVSEFNGDRFNIGMILARRKKNEIGDTCWRRLGICIWDLSHLTLQQGNAISNKPFLERLRLDGIDAPEKNFLEGTSEDWVPLQGFFG